MSPADSASDEIEHDLALAQLSTEQNALYEIDQALRRIRNGTFGVCELTGEPISPDRLRAVPWTRFTAAAEARLEASGEIHSPHLGKLGSVRRERARTLGESEEERELSIPSDEAVQEIALSTPQLVKHRQPDKGNL